MHGGWLVRAPEGIVAGSLEVSSGGAEVEGTRHGRFGAVPARLCSCADGRVTAFERYLKSGSGRAFAKRHFW